MPSESPSQKSASRRSARAAIREIRPSDRRLHSSAIRRIIADSLLHPKDTVLAFAPLPLEPDLLPLITDFPQTSFVFPRVTGHGTMTLHLVGAPSQLSKSSSGIPEPDPGRCPSISPSEISLALVPGLAFNPSNGLRLGHGGGFYDRLLAHADFRAKTVGIAFACQLAIPFPVEPHDQPVAALVTEDGLTACC